MNEAKMGVRLVRVHEKSSVTQGTHVNGPVITVPSEGEPRAISMRPPQAYTQPPISLVFDKEENKRIGDVYNMVKPLTDWDRDLSLSTVTKSLETYNVLPISSNHTVGESSPIKKIECELISSVKATSSHKFSEKVLIKDKIDSYDEITLKKSPESNPPEIPGIAGCNTNSVTAKEPGRILIGGTLPTNICADRIVSTNIYSESTVKNTKVIEGKKSREKMDTGCLDNLMSKIANLKNIDDNPLYTTERSANNTIIAKSSSSHSGSIPNETKITSIEKKESSYITAKESSHTHSNRAVENIPVKTSKSEQIVPKETLFDTQNESHVKEYVSIRNNVIMNSSSNERSHYNVTESVPIKNTAYGPVLAKASYIDKIDSLDLSDLVAVKNRFEQISGTLPFTGKDLYTSKLISENESNTDLLATEKRAVRKGSEGTTSNDPTNSVGEYIPYKNIDAGRIFPTNISITEITVKGPKVIRDKKSNEKINTSCLDDMKSKIAIFKNIHDDTPTETSGTLSYQNVTKTSSVETMESKEISPDTEFKQHVREYASLRNSVKDECRVIELKETPSNERSSSNVTENVPNKTSEPGRIVASQTALLTQSDAKVTVLGPALENAAGHIVAEATPSLIILPIRTSEFGFLAAKKTSNRQSDDNVLDTHIATPPNTQSEITVSNKDGSVKKTESGSIYVKETSCIQTEMNVSDKDIVQMDGLRRTAVQEKSLRKLVLANNCPLTTSGSGSIVARETVPRTLSGPDALNPFKMSASRSIADIEIFNRQNDASAVKEEPKRRSLSEVFPANDATDCVIIKTSGSGSIVARETTSLAVSGPDVLNSITIKMSESGSIVDKEMSPLKIQNEDPIQYD